MSVENEKARIINEIGKYTYLLDDSIKNGEPTFVIEGNKNMLDGWKSELEKLENLEKKFMQEFIDNDSNTIIFNKHKQFFKDVLDSYIHDMCVIIGETQLGKTEKICEFIYEGFRRGINSIVSCDNKIDQMMLIIERLIIYFEDRTLIKNGEIIQWKIISAKQPANEIERCLKEKIMFVVVCLDNNSQIKKVKSMINNNKKEFGVKKILVIHDEGDVVNKHGNVQSRETDQPKSHNSWLNFFEYLRDDFKVKRVFVTATPINIPVLFNENPIKYLFIEKKSSYRGHDDINCRIMDNDCDKQDILKYEIDRIMRNTRDGEGGEAILICIERKVSDKTQFNILMNQSQKFPDILSHTYNGEGISFYSKKDYGKKLRDNKITYTENSGIITIKNKPNHKPQISIKKFYAMCQDLGEKVVLTIGYDLIQRGISYVSENPVKPLSATVLIGEFGKTLTKVNLEQIVGRITGCSRPDLERYLYLTKRDMDEYKGWMTNRKKMIDDLTQNGTLKDTVFPNRVKNVDRPKLKLYEKIKYIESSETNLDMERHLSMWWNNRTSILGKVLRFIYDSELVSENELKEYIKEQGSENPDSFYSTKIHHTYYKSIFIETENKITKLTEEAVSYIRTLTG